MKQSLYLETSVVGAYLDNGEPFRRDLTIRWWEHELPEYRAVVSLLVRRELERVPEPHRTAYLKLAGPLEQVDLSYEAAILAEGYIARHLSCKYIADACTSPCLFHKTTNCEWNCGQMANGRAGAHRLFNTAAGFFVPMIVTPEFLVSEATERVNGE